MIVELQALQSSDPEQRRYRTSILFRLSLDKQPQWDLVEIVQTKVNLLYTPINCVQFLHIEIMFNDH